MRKIQLELNNEDEEDNLEHQEYIEECNLIQEEVNNKAIDNTYINSKTESEDLLSSKKNSIDDVMAGENINAEDINRVLGLKEPNTEEAFVDNNLHFFNFDDYFTV
jgi:hypothetical protein